MLSDIPIHLDVDRVLLAQGANPKIVRQRNKNLVKAAADALAIGQPLLESKTLYRELTVKEIIHHKIIFDDHSFLKAPAIADHLLNAKSVVLILCTIGPGLEQLTSDLVSTNPVLGLALEGLGSAAAEALATESCNHFERYFSELGWQTSIPLNPGMIGWPVKEGQDQIFSILDAAEIGVHLTSSKLMLPRKSISIALGAGPNLSTDGRTCDFCAMQRTCVYQNHYPHELNL